MAQIELSTDARDQGRDSSNSTGLNRPDLRLIVAGALIFALTAARIVGLHLSVLDLNFDESQYWSWSRDLQLGYFSKPPLLAWVIAAAERVCGSSEACLRAPAPLLYLAVSGVVYATADELYGRLAAIWAALLFAFGTGTAFSARIISTDVPLLLWWAVALLAYVKLARTAQFRWGITLGIALGLGVLTKYAMLYFLLGMIVAGALTRAGRQVWRMRALWLGLFVSIVLVVPHVWWNAINDLVTIRHTADFVDPGRARISLVRLLGFFASQFAVFGPVIFGTLLYSLLLWRRHKLSEPDVLMLAFALPTLSIILALALFNQVNANWAAASFVSAVILASAVLVRRSAIVLLVASVGIGMVTQVVLLVGDAHADTLKLRFLSFRSPYEPVLGWRQYAETAGQLARQTGARTIVSDERWEVASLLYYWRDQPEEIRAWRTVTSPLRFDLRFGLSSSAMRPILFVSPCPYPGRLAPFYADMKDLGHFDVPVGITNFRRYFAFRLDTPLGEPEPLKQCNP